MCFYGFEVYTDIFMLTGLLVIHHFRFYYEFVCALGLVIIASDLVSLFLACGLATLGLALVYFLGSVVVSFQPFCLCLQYFCSGFGNDGLAFFPFDLGVVNNLCKDHL